MPANRENRFFQRKKIAIGLLFFFLLTFVLGYTTYESAKKEITFVKNGTVKHVSTHADTVAQLLKDQGVSASSHDKVKPGIHKALNDQMKVVWDPAKKVQFSTKGTIKTEWTTSDTVQDFFNTHHMDITEHDQIKPSLGTEISNGMVIAYSPAFKIDLKVGNDTEKIWTISTTVSQILKDNKVKLSKDDRVEPAKGSTLKPGTDVLVIRVKKETDIVKAPLKYETVTKEDSNLSKGTKKVLSDGKDGQIAKRYEVVFENGKEVSRKLVDKKVVEKSKNRIVAIGEKQPEDKARVIPLAATKKRESTPDIIELSTKSEQKAKSVAASRDLPKSKSDVYYVSSTAYTANCAGCSGMTTTGVNLKSNPNAKVIAVDPSIIPLGTKVYVEGYGYAVAGDTGGDVSGKKIDVFFASESKANNWGSHRVEIKVLN